MKLDVLDFLSAYYPRFLCQPCLATLMTEPEDQVRTALGRAADLQFANADCTNCNQFTLGVRFLRH